MRTPTAGTPARERRRARSDRSSPSHSWGARLMVSSGEVSGEPVDLDELPAELGLDALDRLRRRRRAGDHDPHAPGARHRLARARRAAAASSTAAITAGAQLKSVTPSASHAPQDLLAVDLADDDLARADGGHGVGHAPAVAVKGRQRVQVDVAVREAEVPAERDGVEPAAAVRELHALGPRGRARRVVDRDGRVLVGDASRAARRRGARTAARRSTRRARSGA